MPTIEDYIIDQCAKVPLKSLVPDDTNVRQHFTLKEITGLAKSLAQRGQIQPAVAEKKEERYHIISGNRRYYGAEMAFNRGWSKVNYLLTNVTSPLPEKLRLAIQREENECKERIPPQRIAESVWGKYILMLAKRVEDPSLREEVYEAEDYEKIKELKVSQLLPIRMYARCIGRDPKTVKKYFSFQRLHAEIKEKTYSGKLGFNAACELAFIPNKSDQRSLLFTIAGKKGKPTIRKVKSALRKYRESLEKEILSPISSKYKRTEKLGEISTFVSEAEGFVTFLESVAGFDNSVLDLTSKIRGRELTPRGILQEYHAQLKEVHERLMGFEIYRTRWECQHKKTTLSDFVSKKSTSKSKRDGACMKKAKYAIVDLRKDNVKPSPQNPRGQRKCYDEGGLERLAESIKHTGLIHPLVLMRSGENDYTIIEGHRRFYAIETAGLNRFGALILPKLSREQQLLLMYDSDIFEEVNTHDTLMGIARQYELEKKESPEITISEFCKQQKRWNPQRVKEAISYSRLIPEVRELCQRGLLSYSVGVLMGGLEDKKAQKDFAESAAILNQSAREINQSMIQDRTQATLWPKEEMDRNRGENQKMAMIGNLEDALLGVCSRLQERTFSPEDAKKFIQDYYLSHKFQKFFRTLETAVQNN